MSLSDKIYEGSSDLGLFQSKLGLFVGSLSIIILSIIALLQLKKDESGLIDSYATITAVNCVNNCVYEIKYKVKDIEYTAILTSMNNKIYNVGQNVEITYNIDDPHIVSFKILRAKYIAGILFAIGLIVFGASYFNYYMSSNFKLYSAAQGAGTAASIISSPFRSK